ncbi:MAG: cupin domain-containing protein [Bacteroidales bacterium]|nr:cupin domain-containing protein [Bacteroidales bacterium]
MNKIDLQNIPAKELVPGFHGKFVHTENITFAYWNVEAGAVLPEHSHVHEQVSNLTEGEFEMTVDGEKQILKPGSVVVIQSNVRHSGKAITKCKITDVFYPLREDYL